MIERLVPTDPTYDLRKSLSTLSRSGLSAPVARWEDDTLFKATSTPDGPATVAFRRRAEGVTVWGWGPGADWVLHHAERWLGLHDDPTSFTPEHPLLVELHRRSPGMHFGHTHRVFDALFHCVFEQRVTSKGAAASRRSFTRAYGEPAPGPEDLLCWPTPEALRELRPYHFHPHNVESSRAAILLEAARRAKRLEETVGLPLLDAHRRLRALRGIGPWTANLVAGVALGDPDAVAVGDYHLKNTVAFQLAGEARATDERMLELLEPYTGHIRRVVGYLERTGRKAPRYGPKLSVRDIRGH